MESLPPKSARSAGGRALKHQHVGGDEIPLNITHLGVLTRASKLNMNDDELFDYFFARLQGNEMPMACTSASVSPFLGMTMSQKLLHRISSGSKKTPNMNRI